jgi:hypothetical protein
MLLKASKMPVNGLIKMRLKAQLSKVSYKKFITLIVET